MNYNIYTPEKSKDTTVIITHGIAEYSKSYIDLANHLKANGFTVFTYDLRGHGKSEGKKGYVESYLDFINDLHYLISEVKTTKVFLYGHSMGGIITNIYARMYNDFDGIIIQASPTTYLKELGAFKIIPRFLTNNFKVKTDFNDKRLMHNNNYIKDEYDIDYFYFKMVSEVMFKGMKVLVTNRENYNKPILMIYSKADQMTNIDLAKKCFSELKSKDKTFFELENSYHNIHLDIEKELMLFEVTNWLNERV